jgi:phage terminase large subunit GpA-like protein
MITDSRQTEQDFEALNALDAACWAENNAIKLQGGVWSFKDHPYLIEPMKMPLLQRRGEAPLRMCAMKATQLGWTECMVIIVLHGQIYGHYPKGVLYLFPTAREVSEFSKSRFNPLISMNPTAIGQHVKGINMKGVDTTNLKNINGSMLYLRGARLSLSLEAGNKEGAQLRGLPADTIIFDELDMMDFEDVIVKAEGRLGASKVGTSAYISNPTLPERGISAVFNKSDQRHWHRKCSCGA